MNMPDRPCLGICGNGNLVKGFTIRTGSQAAQRFKGWLQRRQPLCCRIRTRKLVSGQQQFSRERVTNRDERTIEPAIVDRDRGVFLGAQRPRIDIFSTKAFQRSDQIGANSLRDLKNALAQLDIAGVLATTIRSETKLRHAFHATRNDELLRTGCHPHRRKVDRLKP